ncbi:PIN domain-containing protein [Bacillus cereus group sp. BfR-BA-01379]|uniref:PIN domain-containing protein n=1 Tax=Bacillus cereus group sp. BfR-BA-01379 TaxID=2920323 RepID=UPI001F59C85C|nr:PIN domain-containing protein [Bacillus cereus group sp. BfR-BA-01379]
MELYEKYFNYQPDFKKMFEEGAIIVPDTNFLLAAYQSRNVTIDEVKKVLEGLNKNNRLIIPEQVIYEFSENRQRIILEQISSIDDEMNKVYNPQKEMKKFMPAAETSTEIMDAQKKRDDLYNASQEYKKSLKKVREKILALITHDEYFEFIKELCQKSFYPYSKSKDVLREEGLRRISLGIKPGTNENKSDPTGDYIIWSEMMTLKQNVIFVSNDQKKDWIHKNNKNLQLGVDQTLLSEFFSVTGGKYFVHVTPKEFIKFLVPALEKAVEEDLDFSVLNTIPESKGLWEIHLNRIPTIDDVKIVEKIMRLSGVINPSVFLTYEDEKAFSIIASSFGLEKNIIDQITEIIEEQFAEELCGLSYPGAAFYVYN